MNIGKNGLKMSSSDYKVIDVTRKPKRKRVEGDEHIDLDFLEDIVMHSICVLTNTYGVTLVSVLYFVIRYNIELTY